MKKDEISMKVLAAARRAWNDAAQFRADRGRYRRFTYGDQWSDPVRDPQGRLTTEGALAESFGRRPLTNNLIRRLVKCVVGRFRQQLEDAAAERGGAPEPDANNLAELDSRMLEEFLISGCAVQRVVRERRSGGDGVWVDNVSPSRFFVNRTVDPRGCDIELVGKLHDMSATEAVMRFSHGDRRRASEIRALLAAAESRRTGTGRASEPSFDLADNGRCRLVEVWTLEASESLRCHDRALGSYFIAGIAESARLDAENAARESEGIPPIETRWEITTRWHCRWLATDGTVVDEYDSPYRHGSHPFVVKFYPLTDGEVHSLVEDVLDQQIAVNRLITLIDQVIGCSAKGVLLFPQSQLLSGLSLEDITEKWARPGAVIPYIGDEKFKPEQIATNCSDIGARELLQLEMKLFEDVSGVSNALMGRSSGGGNVGFERYESEVRNALVSIQDLLSTYAHFRQMRDAKMAQM